LFSDLLKNVAFASAAGLLQPPGQPRPEAGLLHVAAASQTWGDGAQPPLQGRGGGETTEDSALRINEEGTAGGGGGEEQG
jgi:hypothetical protein